ncbi:MAG TPA: hypothetical protein VE177_04945, partial [Candidatus Binatus sp.]|nr:hypothetical protein [Candidatus Binatus sp.]
MFVEHLSDLRWTSPDHFNSILMAFQREAINNTEALTTLRTSLQVLDLAETTEIFSRTLGLTRDQITGKKILFEYDPESDVDRILKTLVGETASNLEKTILFTRTDGVASSLGRNEPGLKVLLLTTRVSKMTLEDDNLVLLPAYETSLILDSIDKTIRTYAAAPFTIIFDNITHMIFMIGQERTFNLVRQALELMPSESITAVFLLNIKAHDQKIISDFESLFDVEIQFKAGARIPEIRTKMKVQTQA